MTDWKFTDSTNTVVSRGNESAIASAPQIIEWVAGGGAILPFEAGARDRSSEISARLMQIDAESVRPLRAKVAGNATAEDDSKLAALDAEAAALRIELEGMTS